MFTNRPVSVIAAVFLSATSLMAQAPAAGGSYEVALARYKECQSRLPFRHHTDGRETLAQTRRREALSLLIADYSGANSYPEYSRYTIASLLGQFFSGKDSAAPLALLRKTASKPVDTWLWVNTLRGQMQGGTSDDALAIVRDDKVVLHKAAALVALGQHKSDLLPQAISAVCLQFPTKDADRHVLLAAIGGAIWDSRSKANDVEFRKGLRSFAELLVPATKLSDGAQLLMARHLQWTLNATAPFVDAASWLTLLDGGEIKKATNSGTTTARPSFFGIESDGERICYLLDLSDSMCKQISPEVRPKGPVTGLPKKRPKGELPDESDLPWNKIKTRFDLLREQLRISLNRLPKEKFFSVVYFGDDAGTLDSSKGLVKASKGNVDRVMAELDAIVCGAPDAPKSPDGVLRGKTNLHAGLRHAFGLSNKGFVEEYAYVDPAALTEGCDTIFLLSDGAPSWDEFHMKDKDYGEGQVVIDNEYNAPAAARTPMMEYQGPYVKDEWLIADVIRMNAFRRVRIHCIGIGEANTGLLKKLAAESHGVAFDVGKGAGLRKDPSGGK